MSEWFEKIPTVSAFGNDADVYEDTAIRAAATECYALERSGLLAVNHRDGCLSFGVFEWESGPSLPTALQGTDGQIYWRHVFNGIGYANPDGSGLRELRHTYWGEADNSGYIFDPPVKVIGAAFAVLAKWLDQ